jgi:hypothetical protein
MNEKLKRFGEDLRILMDKHGMYIDDASCGCCGHTCIRNRNGEEIANMGDWNTKEGEYLERLLNFKVYID